MIELLSLPFMQRALIAAVLVGVTAPLVGIYLVQKRLALIGDGLGHVALTGVAIGIVTGAEPVLTALAVSVVAAVVIEMVRAQGRASADVVLAVIFYGGIAGGLVVLNTSSKSSPAQVNAFLFGSITSTTPTDLVIFGVLAVAIALMTLLLAPALFAVSNDEEYARASGMPVTRLNLLLAILTATTVVISMRVVGLLLISALMIIPNAVGQYLAGSFRNALGLACLTGLIASLGGTLISAATDAPTGGVIVLTALAVFLITVVVVAIRSSLHRRRHHVATEHPHEHGPGCGHEAIEHEDHLDYLHDGHRHAIHGAGYDDH